MAKLISLNPKKLDTVLPGQVVVPLIRASAVCTIDSPSALSGAQEDELIMLPPGMIKLVAAGLLVFTMRVSANEWTFGRATFYTDNQK
jgi:hypothetical protein